MVFDPRNPSGENRNLNSPVAPPPVATPVVVDTKTPAVSPQPSIGNDWVSRIKDVQLQKRYAQFSEENIFDYVFDNIGTDTKFLVDFGANGLNQGMSNSKYLLDKGWKGLLMDGDNSGNEMIKKEFITAENICELFAKYEVPFIFDFLSIDIDGNDLHILKKILDGGYFPRVIYNEFNGTLPVNESLTIKYNPTHTWGEDNYYGASFLAFKKMLAGYGYTLVHQIATTNMLFINEKDVEQKEYGITYQPQQYHPHNPTGIWEEVK